MEFFFAIEANNHFRKFTVGDYFSIRSDTNRQVYWLNNYAHAVQVLKHVFIIHYWLFNHPVRILYGWIYGHWEQLIRAYCLLYCQKLLQRRNDVSSSLRISTYQIGPFSVQPKSSSINVSWKLQLTNTLIKRFVRGPHEN